jgi:hypothetical protein
LLPAVGSARGVRVQQVFSFPREADDVVRALTIRHRCAGHESFLAKAPPIALKPVLAMDVCLEVADVDDSKRTDGGECAAFGSVNRVCPASELLNARALAAADLGDAMPSAGFELIVCDASFISLTLLLPRWPALLAPGGHVVALVKPQVEVGPQRVAKGGIVRDEALYGEVEAKIRGAAAEAGLNVLDYFDSPITGGDGKREFFLFATPTHACEQTEHST